jgi:4-carboxymuconolactone decarboxylase
MTQDPSPSSAWKAFGDIAPQLAKLSDDVLFGQVWADPALSKRDRSLITCAALIATGKSEQLGFHAPFAVQNGVSRDELVALATHLAFYAGWPSAVTAVSRIRELLGNTGD